METVLGRMTDNISRIDKEIKRLRNLRIMGTGERIQELTWERADEEAKAVDLDHKLTFRLMEERQNKN
jgi:hypothetical protein